MWQTVLKAATVVFLIVCSNGELPEDDFRIINKQDLLATDSDVFEDKTSKSFSQLLFDVARDQVIVGARDAIYRLSLRGLRSFEKAEWTAPVDKYKLCQDKGQTEEDCHNYIKILLSSGHKLFACGTNAFSPQCSWREIESVSTVREWVTGVANCPYSPQSNVTALLTTSGEYYTGTPTDFAGSDTAICRSRGASEVKVNMLRTRQYDMNWLNEPQFVGSFENDQYVYFIFREVAVEFMNCGKIIYSRIARVCKNDSGGHLMMKDKWSTYIKARLNCSVPGEYPFYYDEVQSIEYLPEQKILVAVFTTPSNSIAGSAVCFYSITSINEAFEGPFKVQENSRTTWEPKVPSLQARDHFRCKRNLRPHETIEYHGYQLMYEAVQPISGEPLYKTTLQRFTHVTADTTLTKGVGRQFVIFVATQDSDVLKLAVLPKFKGACLVERWRLKDQRSGYEVQSLQFVKDTMSVYIGSDSGVLRIGAHRCGRYASRAACLGATDPYCGWDDARDKCTEAVLYLQDINFVQTTDHCPLLDMPVDGGWSSWSEWDTCVQDSGLSYSLYSEHEKLDMCLCRTRQCNNPQPANGGQSCKGSNIAVSNCTVHGEWSAWSPWSECSATCGIAVKSRRRSCTSPEPKYGGRVCVGQDTTELYCLNLPPCPDPELAPVDGGWSQWSLWSSCNGQGCGAGAGFKERRRTCTDPLPKYGGADCEGNKVEKQTCDLKPCEVKKVTTYTPWMQIPSNSSDGSYTKKRFKVLCKAPSLDQMRVSVAKEEDLYCNPLGCSNIPPEEDSGWESWGPWGECSASCGGGQQSRRRRCRSQHCVGSTDMLRACNSHPCTGEWSCWTDWGECTGDCDGPGYRVRTRKCLSPEGCADAGAATEKQLCINNCPESEIGWSAWSEWGECANGGKVRRRHCKNETCTGPSVQLATCSDNNEDNELSPMVGYGQGIEMASFVAAGKEQTMNIGGIVGCILAAYFAGFVTCLAIMVYCAKKRGNRMPWRSTTKVPSSPHYITAKQNSYVTVPLKDVPRKAKRQPSFTGIVGSSGTLLTKSNNLSNANNHTNTLTTPKLYPKAIANEYDSVGTLKRHSHQTNNKNNIDYEEDKFY